MGICSSESLNECGINFELTDDARRITHPLVGLSSLSRCADAQYAKVAKVDKFGVPNTFKAPLNVSFAAISRAVRYREHQINLAPSPNNNSPSAGMQISV